MTLTLNDTIELLKAILEECGVDCIVLIISSVVANGTILIPSFNTIKMHGIPLRSIQFLMLFLRNSSLKFEIMAKQLYVASQRVL